jgi:hypothetical protein
LAGNTEDQIIGGASNDDAESVLRKHLNSALAGPNWDALIYAISRGDQLNWDNAKAIFKQLNLSTATGEYLEQRALDRGVSKPTDVGIGDESFQKYAIKRSSTQLTSQVLYEMMEILYGSDAVRANTTSIGGPFVLVDGDDLILWIDKKTLVHVVFTAEDFASISNAHPIEVSAAITRACELNQCKAYAAAITDVTTSIQKVRFYSQTLGPSSSVVILGGKAQNVLQFPTLLNLLGDTPALPVWSNITYYPQTGRTRFLSDTSNPTTLNLNDLQPGDYVNIYGSEFDPDNRGSYEVKDVYYEYGTPTTANQWFEIELAGTNQTNVTQINSSGIMYFRKTYGSTFAGERTVSIVQNKDKIRAVLPATSSAVTREPYTAAYTKLNTPLTATQVSRDINGLVTVTTSINHGLSVGDQVIVDGAYADLTPPTTTAEDFAVPRTNYSPLTRTSKIKKTGWTWPGASQGVPIAIKNGNVIYWGGDNTLPSTYIYTPVSSTTVTPGTTYYTYNITTLAEVDANQGAASFRDDGTTNGKSMFTGGVNNATSTYLNTSYEYDGTSISTRANINTARVSHAQVTLNTDSYFICGGENSVGTVIATSEKWTFNAWTNKASMNTARSKHKAVVLTNGNVLVIGGVNNSGDELNSCEIYDVVGNTWTYTGSMTYARKTFNCHTLSDGRVVVMGGIGYHPAQNHTEIILNTCEIYDPTTGRWSGLNDMQSARYSFASALINNRIYVFGGADDVVLAKKDTEYLDLSTFKWCKSTDLPVASSGGVAAITGNNALIVGGYDSSFTLLDHWQMFIPASDSFYANNLNGQYSVASIPSATTFTYSTPSTLLYTKATNSDITVTKVASVADSVLPGPYVFDPDDGVAITNVYTTITQDLNIGQGYASVNVTDASDFSASSGWLVFGFGTNTTVGPVKYLGKLSDTEILIDASFSFTATVPSGSTVIVLNQKGPLNPDNASELGSFYLTASSAGRLAASEVLDDMVATGFTVDKIIVYPGDRGLGAEGFPSEASNKLSDKVLVWGGNDLDAEYETAQEGD